MMKQTKEVKKIGNVLLIDGEYWQFVKEYDETGAMVFERIDKKKFDAIVEKLTERLAPSVDKKEILKEALGELPMKNLERISNLLEKKKVKPRKKYGCLELGIGQERVCIRS